MQLPPLPCRCQYFCRGDPVVVVHPARNKMSTLSRTALLAGQTKALASASALNPRSTRGDLSAERRGEAHRRMPRNPDSAPATASTSPTETASAPPRTVERLKATARGHAQRGAQIHTAAPRCRNVDTPLDKAYARVRGHTRMSQATASSAPPPNASPFSAAITGSGKRRMASSAAWDSSENCLASSVPRIDSTSRRSPPAAKLLVPADVTMARRSSCRSRYARNARRLRPARIYSMDCVFPAG